MQITPNIKFEGNRIECLKWLGAGKAKLRELVLQMESTGLMQGARYVRPQPGVTIKCVKSFNQTYLTITILGKGGEVSKDYECICGCNFTIGQVVNVDPDSYDYKVLSVTVCNNKNNYFLFENVLGSDFTPWYAGQLVILMAYKGFLFDCCNSTFDSTGCIPEIDTITPHDDSWRPTYRAVPFCNRVDKWVVK